MREEKQRHLWKLKVQVKAHSFQLKLKLQRTLPSWKLHRLSFLLRIRKHFLKVESESLFSNFRKRKRKFRSRLICNLIFLDFLRKLKPKNRELAAIKRGGIKSQETICAVSFCIGLLGFLFGSIFEKDGFIHGLSLLLCAVFTFLRFVAGKRSNVLLILTIITSIRSSVICFNNYFDDFPGIFKGLLRQWGVKL